MYVDLHMQAQDALYKSTSKYILLASCRLA